MKFTIEGFSQQRAVELGLAVEDLVILRWFVDFWPSEKMTKMQHNGKMYALVNYSGFIEQMPIIGCNKRTIARKFQRLVEADVLENTTIKQGGTFSVYRFGSNYDSLVQKSVTVAQDCTVGLHKNEQPGMYENVQPNTNLFNSTNLINTKEQDTPYNPPEGDGTQDFKSLLDAFKADMRNTDNQHKEEKLGFDDWYSHYPRKQARQRAEKAWKKIKPDQKLIKHMIDAVEVMKTKESWTKDNGQYIPLPATWLNDGRWDDEEAQPPEKHRYELLFDDNDTIEERFFGDKVKVKVIKDD